MLATSYTDQKIMLVQGQGPGTANIEPAREGGSIPETSSVPAVLGEPPNTGRDLNFLVLGEEDGGSGFFF